VRLDREVREAGARLLVMSVPAIQEVDEEMMADVERTSQKVCMKDPPPYRQLDKLLDELDIEYLNLLAAFREAQQQADVELFRRSDMHWNAQGHALAARELAAALEHRGYLGAIKRQLIEILRQ
jgi:lysophospholipase L1-like esterase